MDKSLRKALGQKPATAKEAISALHSLRDALGASELKVQFHELDELGCTISQISDSPQSLKVQVWADSTMENLLHLACPLTELKKINLNKSAILSQEFLYSFLTDRQGKSLALVHSLDTKAGFPLETVLAIAWALSFYGVRATEFLMQERV